ncbi:MAG TPA: hypothetical protein VND98_02235 [Solirubrobacterales bacterium]|nr:hypothetical protein [Solirubrobacterales bacterium]
MSKLKLKRPAPGTVLGTLALIVAVAGNTGAFAGTGHKITRADIAKGAVTANAIAPGAVRAKALAKNAVHSNALAAGSVNAGALATGAVGSAAIGAGAVTSKALAKGAVGAESLAADAVTASALAPNSVYGGALGPVTVHSAPIADLDEIAQNATWTASNSESALCATGERLLTGGVAITNPGNREVAVLEALPFSNSEANGMLGRITSNSGGTAAAEVEAICLK